MTTTVDTVEELGREAREALAAVADDDALEAWRTSTLGRSGTVTAVLRTLGELDPDARREIGRAANVLKNELESALEQRREDLRGAALATAVTEGAIDVTLPGRQRRRGGLHPITRTMREIVAVFERMGFDTIEGPEVETDEYNFQRLRIPTDHPARDMQDTFWIEPDRTLLRTHTSPMQIRHMDEHEPPIRICVPGRVYRYEATDATHDWMYHNVELLAVDEGVSMADLKGTLLEFARAMFGPSRKVLLRNGYFAYVEPGVELAVDCFRCDGDLDPTCPICRGGGWLEVMGAGMVHPELLEAAGYDSSRYTGFAAGMGPERIAMLKYGIDDIRNFYQNDLRFLRQF
ncbi:MAG: phenylalanine--tRNA ligase subunit alpha [Dehalococcoidia bacterium]